MAWAESMNRSWVRAELMGAIGVPYNTAGDIIRRLFKMGLIERVERGRYRRAQP